MREVVMLRWMKHLSYVMILLLTGCGILPFTQAPTATFTPQSPTVESTASPTAIYFPSAQPTIIPSTSPTTTPSPFPTVTLLPTMPVSTNPSGTQPASLSGGLLQKVRARGHLLCGVNGELPGFSAKTATSGDYVGFEADFCRVIATAIFGNPKAVEFVPLTTQDRFTAVVQGTVDVLIRNTTWTATRDTGMDDPQFMKIRLDFGPTIFHDGQRFMVRRGTKINGTNLEVSTIAHLMGKRICVIGDTTTEMNLTDQFKARGIEYTPVIGREANEVFANYENGACDAVTSDSSQLVSRRVTFDNPSDHIILEEPISREPLGPVFVENDSQWRDVVSWSIFATIYAEELGVDSTNAGQLIAAPNPDIRRLLGSEGSIGINLGLSNDFALRIIQEVGNYEEIYQRNLGPSTPYNLDRGPNKAWNKGVGGVLSSPPFR